MTNVEREVENVMALLPQGSWRRFALERVRALMQAVQDECKAKIEALPSFDQDYDDMEEVPNGDFLNRADVLATFSVQESPPKDIRETLIDPDTL